MKALLSKPFNLLAFNCMWLGCVLGREQWLWLVAPAVFLYIALLTSQGRLDWRQIALPSAIGISVDLLMTMAGVFHFDNAPLLLPAWLLVLWLAFSTTLSLSLSFLRQSICLPVVAGALAFPFNYGVGERLGAVEFPLSYPVVMLTLAVTWMLLLPVLVRASLDQRVRYVEST